MNVGVLYLICETRCPVEKCEDIKGVIKTRKSRDRQNNGSLNISVAYLICETRCPVEKCEDIKGEIRTRKSKDRQNNGSLNINVLYLICETRCPVEKCEDIKGISGVDPGFQARGGALKKIAPSGGRSEKFWGISCEKSRFYANKSYFFQF